MQKSSAIRCSWSPKELRAHEDIMQGRSDPMCHDLLFVKADKYKSRVKQHLLKYVNKKKICAREVVLWCRAGTVNI